MQSDRTLNSYDKADGFLEGDDNRFSMRSTGFNNGEAVYKDAFYNPRASSTEANNAARENLSLSCSRLVNSRE